MKDLFEFFTSFFFNHTFWDKSLIRPFGFICANSCWVVYDFTCCWQILAGPPVSFHTSDLSDYIYLVNMDPIDWRITPSVLRHYGVDKLGLDFDKARSINGHLFGEVKMV